MKMSYTNALAIIVTYYPDPEFEKRCKITLMQFKSVVVVDNGSVPSLSSRFPSLFNIEGVYLINNEVNKGLGFALNQGVTYAVNNGYRWVCTLDQDSCLTSGYADALFCAVNEVCNRGISLGLLSPVYVDGKSGAITSYGDGEPLFSDCERVSIAITSGNLIPVETFKLVGMFDESLFIDYIDYDFSLRCSLMGRALFEVRGARLIHNLGAPIKKKFLGKEFFVSNHNHIRRYYISRNRMIIISKYFRYYPILMCNELFRNFLDFSKIIFYEENKLAKCKAIFRGYSDFIKKII